MKNVLLIFILVMIYSACFASENVHWGYEGHEGPANWGDLSEDFHVCKSGVSQSPINIDTGDVIKVSMEPISFSYKTSGVTLVNNGHTLQANYDRGSYITIKGQKFELLQFHFHSPSENTVNSNYFDMEAHLVHKSAKGELAVVSVLLKGRAENQFLKQFWSAMPDKSGVTRVLNIKFSVMDFLPTNQSYYHFDGSLTTPPCSEGVHWFVLQNPVSVSKKQVEAFTTNIIKHNERPTQPVNARNVLSNPL
ncbi:MAG: hypothetical protein C0602_03335 [Denitrovibrio sp.]|nr:MAG: hypothetical protein C0602_03335 [Denitrovibrio sp.]